MKGEIQVELQRWMGSDTDICDAAWTSTFDRSRRETKYDDPKKVEELIYRLANEGHSTPFESIVFRFWLRIPIFVDRQLMTHRLQSSSGLSGRYRTLPEDWYSLPHDVLNILQDINSHICKKTTVVIDYSRQINERHNQLMKDQFDFYKQVLTICKDSEKDGVISNAQYKRVREVIRGVIGTSSMVERTSIFNLRSFANFQRLRNSEHAQAEIRQVAQLMLAEVEKSDICPLAIDALKNIGWRI